MKTWILSSALLATICWPVSADSLFLKDGRVIRGTFLGGSSREIRFAQNGGANEERFELTTVDNVVFGNGGGGDADRSRTVAPSDNQIPSGTMVTVRLIDPIDSDKNSEGQTFRASLDEPLVVNGRTVADRGADATVKVVRVQQSGRLSGQEEVELVLSELSMNGRMQALNTGPARVSEKSRGAQSAKVIGGTAIVGAIIGAIAGGGKGAAIGAASGAGAGTAIQAIRGQRVQIPSESRLDFPINDPIPLNR